MDVFRDQHRPLSLSTARCRPERPTSVEAAVAAGDIDLRQIGELNERHLKGAAFAALALGEFGCHSRRAAETPSQRWMLAQASTWYLMAKDAFGDPYRYEDGTPCRLRARLSIGCTGDERVLTGIQDAIRCMAAGQNWILFQRTIPCDRQTADDMKVAARLLKRIYL